MTLWQYNAYREAFSGKQRDLLCLQLQAEYYGAYWNSMSKHKKSLDSVIGEIQKADRPKKSLEKISQGDINWFKKVKELERNGKVKYNSLSVHG